MTEPLNERVADCPICSRRTTLIFNHDHFLNEIVLSWRRLAAVEGLSREYADRHMSRVALVKQGTAVGRARSVMRFATTLDICGLCNNLDAVIKGNGLGGKPRFEILSTMINFSLTPDEIRSCVLRVDGSRRHNTDPDIMPIVSEILAREDWAGRLTRADEVVRAAFEEVVKEHPPG